MMRDFLVPLESLILFENLVSIGLWILSGNFYSFLSSFKTWKLKGKKTWHSQTVNWKKRLHLKSCKLLSLFIFELHYSLIRLDTSRLTFNFIWFNGNSSLLSRLHNSLSAFMVYIIIKNLSLNVWAGRACSVSFPLCVKHPQKKMSDENESSKMKNVLLINFHNFLLIFPSRRPNIGEDRNKGKRGH